LSQKRKISVLAAILELACSAESFKTVINALASQTVAYKYRDRSDNYRTATMPGLTLTRNGNYAGTVDALNVVADCK
jgi:hypothetical protein